MSQQKHEQQRTDTTTSQYAETLVKMLSSSDSSVIMDYSYTLKQLDEKLRQKGMKATIKVGVKKIE